MSIESRVPQYGTVFEHWQIDALLRADTKTAVFRLVHVDDTQNVCALKVINLIEEPGSLSQLSEADWEAYTALRRQRRKILEKQLLTNGNCLEYTFLDWEDENCFGRDLLMRTKLPSEPPADHSMRRADIPPEPQDFYRDEEEPEESGNSNVLLKVLIVLIAVAILCVGFIFGKIILELKNQVDQAAVLATAPPVTIAEIPTEIPTEAPNEAPTEAPVPLDPTKVVDLSIGQCHVAAVYEDGSVDVVYLNESMRRKYPAWDVWDASGSAQWTDIIQVSVGKFHMAGLKSDGTVVAIGGNDYGECDTSEWTDIIAIATGDHVTVGLKSDGTVVSSGSTVKIGNVDYMSDVAAIDMGSGCLEYVQRDGSWKRRLPDGSEQNFGTYPELVKTYSNDADSVGILSDGTLIIARTTRLNKTKLSEWTDIVDVYGNTSCMLGLKSDGTVCAFGTDNQNYQQNVVHWAGIEKLVGPSAAIKKDGTIVLSGTALVQSFDLGPLNKAPSVTEGEPGRIVNTSSGVNVRSYPGINCDVVNKLPLDTPVIILEQKSTYDGKLWGRTMYGWVSMDYVELD